MSSSEENPSVSEMASAIKSNSDGTNFVKEYRETLSNPDGSDKKGDAIVDNPEESLELLKALIENTKLKTTKEKKKVKWEFKTSPHEQFGKTLDDTFMAFILWAKVKQTPEKGEGGKDESDGDSDKPLKYNVSKAFRRVEAYAAWMDEEGADLAEPALTAPSVKPALDALNMKSSVDKEGRYVWWIDLKAIDQKAIKKDVPIQDSFRAFVWYVHYVMYHPAAQEKGMVFVESCEKLGFIEFFTMFPMKLSSKLDRLTIGILPVKMTRVYIMESPGWMKALMKFMGMFMSKKIKSRFVVEKDWSVLEDTLGSDCVPVKFGKLEGKLEVDIVIAEYFSN